MNKRQRKKHLRKALALAVISFDLADRYLARYHFPVVKQDDDFLFESEE